MRAKGAQRPGNCSTVADSHPHLTLALNVCSQLPVGAACTAAAASGGAEAAELELEWSPKARVLFNPVVYGLPLVHLAAEGSGAKDKDPKKK